MKERIKLCNDVKINIVNEVKKELVQFGNRFKLIELYQRLLKAKVPIRNLPIALGMLETGIISSCEETYYRFTNKEPIFVNDYIKAIECAKSIKLARHKELKHEYTEIPLTEQIDNAIKLLKENGFKVYAQQYVEI